MVEYINPESISSEGSLVAKKKRRDKTLYAYMLDFLKMHHFNKWQKACNKL
jgi:hypothetical protein